MGTYRNPDIFPIYLPEHCFDYVFWPIEKNVDEQHFCVIDDRFGFYTAITITTYIGNENNPKLKIFTPNGDFDSYKNPEKMTEFFGENWENDLAYALKNCVLAF